MYGHLHRRPAHAALDSTQGGETASMTTKTRSVCGISRPSLGEVTIRRRCAGSCTGSAVFAPSWPTLPTSEWPDGKRVHRPRKSDFEIEIKILEKNCSAPPVAASPTGIRPKYVEAEELN